MKWYTPLLFLGAGLLLAGLPLLRETLGFPSFYLFFLYFVFFWIAQASSWNMFSGYSGYFSFGQGAFFGIGVYTTSVLVFRTQAPFLLTLPVAGVLAALLALFIGLVVFRLRKLRGELFALLTLAVSLVMAAIARTTNFIDGGFGIPLGRVPYPEFLGEFSEMIYRLGLLVALLTVFTSYIVFYSRFGTGLFSIRDDEDVAEGLGVPTFRYKMQIFALASFFAGLSGGLHALQLSYVTVEGVFSIRLPLFVILMSVLGGRTHWLGPVIGAIIIYSLNDAFNSARLEFYNDIFVGLLLIIMILFVPEGIYLRLRKRLLPASIVFVATLGLQLLFPIATERLITQISISMFLTIGLLLIPDRLFARLSPSPAAT